MNHYYTDNSDLSSERKEFTYYFDNEVFRFTTDNGVFSKDNVDYGSYILIRSIYSKDLGKTLLDLGLVRLVGRSELPGHPFLYGTTQFFLEHFGLASLGDLDGIDPTLQRANPRARAAAYKKPEPEKTELEQAAEEEQAAAEAAKAAPETPPPAKAEQDEEVRDADEADAEGVVYSADVPADGKETSDDEDFFIDDTPDEFDDEDEDDDEEDEDDDEEDEDDDDADEDEDEEDDDDE